MRRAMSVRIGGAIAAGAALAAIVPALPAVGRQSPPVGEQSPPRVTICHKPGTPAEKTLILPEAAVRAHLGHGDALGSCPMR